MPPDMVAEVIGEPRKLPAAVGVADVRKELAVDHATGEIDQYRSKRGPACQVRDLSNGSQMGTKHSEKSRFLLEQGCRPWYDGSLR